MLVGVSGNNAFAAAQEPQVRVNGEVLVGVDSPARGVSAFLGIPFAKPPIGALRWSAPVDYSGDGGTRRAGQFAPACMQTMRILDWYRGMAEQFGSSRSVFPDLRISEDCLYLNVWAPKSQPRSRLPVMVYFHGGSNNSGWSYEPNYHGHALAAQGAVVVSIAYRLGVFGFFSHPQLANEKARANFGLWDQLAALRWVQKNIATFGGDPQRVTVFGESSGAGDLGMLMMSAAANGLLHRAIMQSASNFGYPQVASLDAEQARGLQLARTVNPAAPPDLAGLRALPAEELLRQAGLAFPGYYHAPVLDGAIVTAQLSQRVRRRDWPLRQLLIGTNANEFYERVPGAADDATVTTAVANADVLSTPAVSAELKRSPDAANALDRLATAESMLCPAQRLATAVAAAGRPVWMYRFARVRDGEAAAALKAYHGAELPYVFGTHDAWLPTSEVDWQLSRQMMQAWVQFARTGSPQGSSFPAWTRFKPVGRRDVLNWDAKVELIERPEPVLCRIYDERLDRLAQAAR